MSDLPIEHTCPFGHKCQEIKDEAIHRCRLYINVQGKDPQSEKVIDQWNCAFSWQPILTLEGTGMNRGVLQTLESLRNNTEVNQKAAVAKIAEIEEQKRIASDA